MDFSFITNKIAEAQQAVANAFARTAKAEQTALAGQPTSDQLTAAANSLQAIIDAANGVAPNVTLP